MIKKKKPAVIIYMLRGVPIGLTTYAKCTLKKILYNYGYTAYTLKTQIIHERKNYCGYSENAWKVN